MLPTKRDTHLTDRLRSAKTSPLFHVRTMEIRTTRLQLIYPFCILTSSSFLLFCLILTGLVFYVYECVKVCLIQPLAARAQSELHVTNNNLTSLVYFTFYILNKTQNKSHTTSDTSIVSDPNIADMIVCLSGHFTGTPCTMSEITITHLLTYLLT